MLIYIHNGSHKAGSSTIQAWLSHNRAQLRAMGFLYPGRRINHNGLPNALRGKNGKFQNAATALLSEIRAEIDAADDCHATILSGEAFELLDDRGLKTLCEALAPHSISAIRYVRPQWETAVSSYTQRLKFPSPGLDVTRWIARRTNQEQAKALAVLKRWTDFLGPGRLDVRPFERGQFAKGDLLEDFKSAVGLADHPLSGQLQTVASTNVAPGLNTLRVFHSLLPEHVEPVGLRRRQLFREPILRASKVLGWSHRRAALLSKSQQLEIERRLTPVNSFIAREYLARPDGHLFLSVEKYSTAPEVADSLDIGEVSADEICLLLIQLILDETENDADADKTEAVAQADQALDGRASAIISRLEALCRADVSRQTARSKLVEVVRRSAYRLRWIQPEPNIPSAEGDFSSRDVVALLGAVILERARISEASDKFLTQAQSKKRVGRKGRMAKDRGLLKQRKKERRRLKRRANRHGDGIAQPSSVALPASRFAEQGKRQRSPEEKLRRRLERRMRRSAPPVGVDGSLETGPGAVEARAPRRKSGRKPRLSPSSAPAVPT